MVAVAVAVLCGLTSPQTPPRNDRATRNDPPKHYPLFRASEIHWLRKVDVREKVGLAIEAGKSRDMPASKNVYRYLAQIKRHPVIGLVVQDGPVDERNLPYYAGLDGVVFMTEERFRKLNPWPTRGYRFDDRFRLVECQPSTKTAPKYYFE
jgi:hypothetical protein